MYEGRTKQQQMYIDMVQIAADITRKDYGIDIVNNPLFRGAFERILEKHHNVLESFILKYCPIETPPVQVSKPISVPEFKVQPQPVVPEIQTPVVQKEQSEQEEKRILLQP